MKTERIMLSMKDLRLMPSAHSLETNRTRAREFRWEPRRFLLVTITLLLPLPVCSQVIKLATANGGTAEVLGGSSPKVEVYDSSRKANCHHSAFKRSR